MKILITGGAGFIGSHLTRRLFLLGHDIFIVDNFSTGKRTNLPQKHKKIHIFHKNIEDYHFMKKIISQVDILIHLAAKVTVLDSTAMQHEYMKTNAESTKKLLKLAYTHNIKKFIFASSAAVYGNKKAIPIHEDMKRKPISQLGRSKMKAEIYCTYYKKKGLDVTILRFFNVYGSGQNLSYKSAISYFLNLIENNKPLVLYGKGNQTRDFIYIDDVVDAFIACIIKKTDCPFIFNIGSGQEQKINNVIKMLFRITNRKKHIIYVPKKPEEIDRSVACITLAKYYLQFTPKNSLEKGLRRMIQARFSS